MNIELCKSSPSEFEVYVAAHIDFLAFGKTSRSCPRCGDALNHYIETQESIEWSVVQCEKDDCFLFKTHYRQTEYSPDEVMTAERRKAVSKRANALYRKALADYETGVEYMKITGGNDEVCLYAGEFLSRCAENLLKCQIALQGDPVPRTHAVSVLVFCIAGHVPDWILDDCEEIDECRDLVCKRDDVPERFDDLRFWYPRAELYLLKVKSLVEEFDLFEAGLPACRLFCYLTPISGSFFAASCRSQYLQERSQRCEV